MIGVRVGQIRHPHYDGAEHPYEVTATNDDYTDVVFLDTGSAHRWLTEDVRRDPIVADMEMTS